MVVDRRLILLDPTYIWHS